MTTADDVQYNGTFIYQYPCENSTTCSSLEVTLHVGLWKIECWGASGGDSFNRVNNHVFLGGRGGYSSGLLRIESPTKLFINIGGQGISNKTSNKVTVEGGYNGGGKGYTGVYTGASGGGATDVRMHDNTIENRIIIAGGGGGAGSPNTNAVSGGTGGHGGGLRGLNAEPYSSSFLNSAGNGGDQEKGGNQSYADYSKSEAGSLFKGGDSETSSESSSGGGGGGYYGGSGGASTGGGGGSGFVSLMFRKRITIDGNNTFISPLGFKEHGHTGNGAVKFTYMFPCFKTCKIQRPRCLMIYYIISLIYS